MHGSQICFSGSFTAKAIPSWLHLLYLSQRLPPHSPRIQGRSPAAWEQPAAPPIMCRSDDRNYCDKWESMIATVSCIAAGACTSEFYLPTSCYGIHRAVPTESRSAMEAEGCVAWKWGLARQCDIGTQHMCITLSCCTCTRSTHAVCKLYFHKRNRSKIKMHKFLPLWVVMVCIPLYNCSWLKFCNNLSFDEL